MRPTTPKFNLAAHANPSSPPETPTSPQFNFQYRQYKTRRNGMVFGAAAPAAPSNPINIPREQPRTASPFYAKPTELSPRTSSPASSDHSSTRSTSFPIPRSLSSSPTDHISSSPPARTKAQIISFLKANFTVEELRDSEYEDWDSEDGSVIRPSQYEDAESERGSVKSGIHGRPPNGTTYTHLPNSYIHRSSPGQNKNSPHRATPQKPMDPRVMQNLTGLHFGDSESEDEDEDSDDERGYAEHQAWVERQRAEKRRIRRTSSLIKRNFTQSLGSGSDEEDIVPLGPLDANDPGSSARRLRRRTQDGRISLVFDEPPPRIDEMEEPESCEEVVEMGEDEVREGLAREFPYYIQQEMDVDETSNEEETDDDSDSDEE